MAKGSNIVVKPRHDGRAEGIVSGTPKPGTLMQIKAATEPQNGVFTWTAYNRDADGNRPQGPLAVLDIDLYQGKVATDAYTDGSRCQLWLPIPGEEFNLLVSAAGTGAADAQAIGDLYIADDGTGYLVATTGSPESESFACLETVTDVVATGTLVWCIYTGY